MDFRSAGKHERKAVGGIYVEIFRADDIREINLLPETEAEDVKQCLAMICGTPKGSVPFMREFGISASYMHGLMEENENSIAEDVADQIEKYEHRIEVEDIEFEADEETGYMEYTIPYTLLSEEAEDEE